MTLYQKISNFIVKNQRHLSSGTLVLGFVIDNLTLNRIDQLYDNLVIIFYLILAGFVILAFNFIEFRNLQNNLSEKFKIFAPLIIQYAFGGLLSAFFVFYSRSGSLYASWPFILLILTLLILNEFLKEKYSRLIYQTSIYFFTIFSYMIFLIPVLLKKMGPVFFIYSGLISLVLIYVFSILLHILSKKNYFYFNKKMWLVIFAIYFVMNLLYFTKILPPLPLSLKEAGIFHHIERVDNNYLLTEQQKNFFEKFFNKTIEIKNGENLYYFSSIFAPTKLTTKIFHEWQFYDEKNKKWVTASKIPFAIVGGRDRGYRGYSMKQNLSEGKWRIFTKTGTNQIIGRDSFTVKFTDEKLNFNKLQK
jgi:hypothetical protein